MIFVVLILLFIIANSTKSAKVNEFYGDYLSKENTTSIKGIFVILVFFRHYVQYVSLSGIYDKPFTALDSYLNQLIVAIFLFYSGFGILESIRNKGFDYVKTVPTKRFLVLLVNFDLAVLLFWIVKTCLSETYDLQTVLLAFVGWTSLGNSNWYIFVTLVFYLLVFVSFFVVKWLNNNGGRLIGCILLTVLTVAFVYSQMVIERPRYTYNTAILFPLGCWYSLFKPQIDAFFMKNDFVYTLVCAGNIGAFLWSYFGRFDSIEMYTIWAISFTLMIVLFTMKFKVKSNVLDWFGNHVFSVYILQRIPMIILSKMGFAQSHKYLFFVSSFIITILISIIFDYLTAKMWKKVWRKSK